MSPSLRVSKPGRLNLPALVAAQVADRLYEAEKQLRGENSAEVRPAVSPLQGAQPPAAAHALCCAPATLRMQLTSTPRSQRGALRSRPARTLRTTRPPAARRRRRRPPTS